MLNTFSKNTYNKIKILEGTNNKVNPNHPIVPIQGGARPKMTHIQPGNNILSSGGYSLHQFQKAIGKAEKTVVKVAKEGEMDRGCMVRVHWSGNTTMDGDREVDGELVGEPPPSRPPKNG